MNELTILGGYDKSGLAEPVSELTIKLGEVYSIVGFTGSGKSQLIGDIEQMAQRDTVTKRQILIDGQVAFVDLKQAAEKKLVAHLSQNMNFVMEMEVEEFLRLHASCRGAEQPGNKADEVLACANSLAGEPIKANDLLVSLSGGQSRALMIADVAVISNSPIILIDEVENAGIDRQAALQILSEHRKITLVVTHDPLLALMGERRIVMARGAMRQIIDTDDEEMKIRETLKDMSNRIAVVQDRLRKGEKLREA